MSLLRSHAIAPLTLWLTVFVAFGADAAETSHHITDVLPIPIGNGITPIADFNGQGAAGIVVCAFWSGEIMDGTYNTVMIMIRNPAFAADENWHLVRIAGNNEPGDATLTVSPFPGDQQRSGFRLAHAKVDGVSQTLLVTARRDWSNEATQADPEPVIFRIYLLSTNDDFNQTSFSLLEETRSAATYLSIDDAFSEELAGFN